MSWHRFIYILLVHLLAYHHYMCGCLLIRISFLVLKLSVFQQKILLFLGNSPLYYGSNNFTCTFILMLKMKQKHIILLYKEICVYEVTCSFYLPPDSSCIIIYINSVYYWFVFYRFERCSYIGLMCDAKLLINWNRPI
jgi:putative component of membrane protein insertase Oxa1/YidC/SpoIIIJ protein YidD